MARYIDAEKLKFFIADVFDRFDVPIGDKVANAVYKQIDNAPTADVVELPYKPFPVVMAEDENNSDLFCPFCDTDLSGHYYGGDYETPKIVPCFECGTWLDGTKAITKEEAKNLCGERKTDNAL